MPMHGQVESGNRASGRMTSQRICNSAQQPGSTSERSEELESLGGSRKGKRQLLEQLPKRVEKIVSAMSVCRASFSPPFG